MALYTVNAGSAVNAADINQFTNLLNGTTTSASVVVANRMRAQLTGATSGSGGYVGQTAASAPTTGTFLTGDIAVDGTFGTVWVCTAGGSPGSWVAQGVQIATQTLSSATASVTFSSLPAFTRFKVFWRARATDAVPAESFYLRLNGDTGTNYLWENVQSNNTTVTGATSGAAVAQIQVGTINGASATTNYFSSGEFTIDGAQNTSSFKTVQGTGTAFATTTNMWAGTFGGQWLSTAAVTSLTLFPSNGGSTIAANAIFTVTGWM